MTAPSNNADQGATKTFPAAVTVSTNGSRENHAGYVLDGVPNVDVMSNVNQPFPFPDALQEFSVQTSNYNAEYGQNAGGVVSIVTKSGTNEFHGDAFGFLRNGVFNARNFFAANRDPLKRGQFGGTFGGPVIKDKTFFFAGYQGTRIRSTQNGLHSYVPTDANLAGDFSAMLQASNPGNPLGLFNWDMGIFKYFPVTERWKLQFRGEFFNVLNHTNFQNPVTTVSSAGFGNILSANDPRILQLALKVLF